MEKETKARYARIVPRKDPNGPGMIADVEGETVALQETLVPFPDRYTSDRRFQIAIQDDDSGAWRWARNIEKRATYVGPVQTGFAYDDHVRNGVPAFPTESDARKVARRLKGTIHLFLYDKVNLPDDVPAFRYRDGKPLDTVIDSVPKSDAAKKHAAWVRAIEKKCPPVPSGPTSPAAHKKFLAQLEESSPTALDSFGALYQVGPMTVRLYNETGKQIAHRGFTRKVVDGRYRETHENSRVPWFDDTDDFMTLFPLAPRYADCLSKDTPDQDAA